MADMPWETLIAEAGDRYNVPPEGEYQAIIEEAESTVSKNSGNQMIACKLKITEGPHSGKRPKTVYVVKSAKAAGMMLQHLKAVGITPDVLKAHNPTMDQLAAAMLNKRVGIKVVHEDYRGEAQAIVEFAMRAPNGGAVEVTAFPAAAAPVAAAAGASASGFDADPGF